MKRELDRSGNETSGMLSRIQRGPSHSDSVRRLPRDGARFERSEDRAYDRAYEAGGSCERLYPTCRYSIYDVDFWNCGRSCDRPFILRNANLMGKPRSFSGSRPIPRWFFCLTSRSFRDASDWRLIKRSTCCVVGLSSLRTFPTDRMRFRRSLSKDSAAWEINSCNMYKIRIKFARLSF